MVVSSFLHCHPSGAPLFSELILDTSTPTPPGEGYFDLSFHDWYPDKRNNRDGIRYVGLINWFQLVVVDG